MAKALPQRVVTDSSVGQRARVVDPHEGPTQAKTDGRAPEVFRPPAIPLIAVDPYFSVWSMTDRLTDKFPKHWTGQNHSMTGMLRIDGKTYRFIGPQPEDVPAMKQTALEVWPTRTIYRFEAAGVALELTFLTPSLPHNLNTLSWPVTYVTFTLHATNNKPHAVQLYFDTCAEFVVDHPGQHVSWSRLNREDATLLLFGTTHQDVLGNAGDDLRIDWGYFYLVIPAETNAATTIGPKHPVQEDFVQTGRIGTCDDLEMPRAVSDGWPALMMACELTVTPAAPVQRHIMLAYHDMFSIEYLHRKLRPYWNRNNMGVCTMLTAALNDYPSLAKKCAEFDAELMADLRQVGGDQYALLGALAFRQTLAAHKLCADIDGTPLYFSKENYSNGCIATVDVTYPAAPFFLLFNPALLEAQLSPIFQYAATPRWRFQFAPHDLGTYPLANGQVYGGGERSEKGQMPVEECGNMILLTAALAKAQGDLLYVSKWWGLLTKWAAFLSERGFDPERQLCTDDFAGRLAHNTNLSIKAILALGAYADLCRKLGKDRDAHKYRQLAESMVKSWIKAAADKDHYRLAFDRPGTWSMKYNLVWDQLLELHLFPPKVVRAELAYYRKKQNRFGLPLDNRKSYGKLDWILWVAYLAQDPREFQTFLRPVWNWINSGKARVPLTDHYWTDTGKQVLHFDGTIGFQARSVVGGVFLPVLKHPQIWQKYLAKPTKESRGHHDWRWVIATGSD